MMNVFECSKHSRNASYRKYWRPDRKTWEAPARAASTLVCPSLPTPRTPPSILYHFGAATSPASPCRTFHLPRIPLARMRHQTRKGAVRLSGADLLRLLAFLWRLGGVSSEGGSLDLRCPPSRMRVRLSPLYVTRFSDASPDDIGADKTTSTVC